MTRQVTRRELSFVVDDGAVLSAAAIAPTGPGPFPAILDAVPYRKDDDFRWLDWSTYAYLAARGFACVRLDLRGPGSSTGILTDEYTARELDDLEQVIAQVAATDWCSGRVGMTGVSWGGFNAVQVAMRRPPALHAIAPIHFSVDRYRNDVHYVGGCLHVQESGAWPGEMVAGNGLPPHPAIVGDAVFERIWRDRLEQSPQWTLGWLRHQRRDDYWRHGSLCEDWASIACPVLAIGGWLDCYVEACLAVLEHCRVPRRAVIGPWGHTRPHIGWPGPPLDHRALLCRWFERWLADVPNGVDAEPELVAYVRDGTPREPYPAEVAGRWRAFHPARPRGHTLHLRDAGLGDAAGAAEARTWRGPQWVGHGMPWWCPGHPPTGHSGDMRRDDACSLVWDSEPLTAPVELLGRPVARVTVSTDRPVALIAVRLEHVHPDGYSALVCRGVLNLTHHGSDADPQPVEPFVPITVDVPLAATGTVIPEGHVLRLAIAGADWPIAWPPPEPVALTVHAGTLDLAVAPLEAETAVPPLPAPEPGPPNPEQPEDGPVATWVVSRDLTSGVTAITASSGSRTRLASGGTTGGDGRVTCEIQADDPSTCRVLAEHVARVQHPGVIAVSRSRLEITCDRDRFHVAIDLEVDRDHAPFFRRRWRESFPRDLC